MTSAQNASEQTPKTLIRSTVITWDLSVNASLSEYRGLVPMSPNTTPIAPKASAPVFPEE